MGVENAQNVAARSILNDWCIAMQSRLGWASVETEKSAETDSILQILQRSGGIPESALCSCVLRHLSALISAWCENKLAISP